jgi:hypothetical protein
MPSRPASVARRGARKVFVTLGALLLGAQTVPLSAQQSPGLVGDVNGDGEITAVDALAVLSHVVGRPLPAGYRVSPDGDNNRDGQITAADALLALSFAVGRDVSQFPVGKPIAVVPSRTIVVDSTTLRLLSDSTADTRRVLRFEPRAGAPVLAPGNVLVGEQGSGFLVYVDSVKNGGAGQIVVHGRSARLTEAVQEGWVRASARLGIGEAPSSSPVLADGAQRAPGDVTWGPSAVDYVAPGVSVENGRIVLNDVVLREGDWGSWRIASGFVEFDPDMDFGWELKDWTVTDFHAQASGMLRYEVQLDLRNQFSVNDEGKVLELYRKSFPFKTKMGKVPVYGEWILEMNLELEGTARYRQRLLGGFKGEHGLEMGVRYQSGEWSGAFDPISESSRLPFSREDEGDLDVRVSVKPTLHLVMYGVAGARIFIQPFLDMDGRVDLTAGRWWDSATVGLDWGFGTSFLLPGVFSLDYPNFEKTWEIFSKNIYADSGDLELDSVRIVQRTPRVSPGGTVQLSLLRYWGDELVQFGPAAQWSSSDPALLGMAPDGTAQAGPNKGSGQVMVEVPIGPDKVLRDAVPVRVADPGDDDDDGGEDGPAPPCNSCGDVHIRTPDGLAYDFQGAGEYLLMRSSDGSVVVQARQEPWSNSDRISVNTALAMNVAGDRVGLYPDRSQRLYINGVPTAVHNGRVTLPNGGVVTVSGGFHYLIRWPNGFRVSAWAYGPWIDMGMSKPAGSALSYAGLLGNMNDVASDDLFTRSGQAIPQPLEFDALYNVFGAGWQITQGESLFDYENGKSVATYARPDFPSVPLAVADLDPAVYAAARNACQAAGITDPIVLNDCILDIGGTGNTEFVNSGVDAPAPRETVRVEYPDGLIGSYYAGYFGDDLNFFATRTPILTRVDNPITFGYDEAYDTVAGGFGIAGLPDTASVSIVWRGRLIVPQSGVYSLNLGSNGASYLFLGDSADDLIASNATIDNGGAREWTLGRAELELSAGEYPITIVYSGRSWNGSVHFRWYNPDLGHYDGVVVTSLGRRAEQPNQEIGVVSRIRR